MVIHVLLHSTLTVYTPMPKFDCLFDLYFYFQEREKRRKEREVTLSQKDKDKEIEVIKVY